MISNDGNISFVTSHTSKHIHNAQLNLNSILDVQHNNLVNLGAFCSTKNENIDKSRCQSCPAARVQNQNYPYCECNCKGDYKGTYCRES